MLENRDRKQENKVGRQKIRDRMQENRYRRQGNRERVQVNRAGPAKTETGGRKQD